MLPRLPDTPRLRLCPLHPDDLTALHQAFSDPEAMRYWHTLPHQSVDETRQMFQHELEHGAHYWTIRLIDGDEVVGFVGFLGNTRVPAMGYLIQRAYWGRGYATQAVQAVLDYGFHELGLDRVELWIHEHNLASQRVAQKLGFRLKGRIHQRFSWEDNHHIMIVYGLRALEWPRVNPTPPAGRPQFFGLQPVLAVHDVAQTVSFYCDRLGFDLDFLYGDPPQHAAVAASDWSPEAVTLQFAQVPVGTPLALTGWCYIFVEAGIDALYEAYVAAGVEIIRPLQTFPWGMREFDILDCNGYQLRFGTHAA